MFYIVVFLFLCILSFFEFKGKNFPYFSFKYLTVYLLIIAALRYGVGGDYFAYAYIYYRVPVLSKFSTIGTLDIHGEKGYLLLCSMLRTLHVSNEIFNVLIAIVTIGLIYKFIKDYSKMPITSLTMFYVLYYLIYAFNGLRQGIALALFLGVGITLLKRKKYIKFILIMLIGSTIHSSILITLLLIPLQELKISYKVYFGIAVVIMLLMIANVDIMIIKLLPTFLMKKILTYWGKMNIPVLALGNRLIMLILILYFGSKAKDDETVKYFKGIYITGFVLYMLTIKSSLISARISVYMKALEIVLIPNLIFLLRETKLKLRHLQLWTITIVLMGGLLYKNLVGFLGEGDFYGDITILQYPYITVLDLDKSRIWLYRERPPFNYKLDGKTGSARSERYIKMIEKRKLQQ